MKTRVHDYFDAKNVCAKYSFEVLINGKWMRPAIEIDGTVRPVMFDTEEERDAKRKEFSNRREATCQK